MVLDYLLTPNKVRHEPVASVILGALFASIAVIVSYALPSLDGGIIAFAALPAVPLFWALLVREEKADEKSCGKSVKEELKRECSLFKRHTGIILVYSFFFLGAVIAYTAWFALLPAEASAGLFESQVSEVNAIGALTGKAFDSGAAWSLFSHNAGVLALMFGFCLLYGIGSIYLLLWNASVIGVFLGGKIVEAGIIGGAIGFLGLLPHGSFELAGYFVGSLSGGILSVALMRGKHEKGGFNQALLDAGLLALAAIILVGLGALLEGSY